MDTNKATIAPFAYTSSEKELSDAIAGRVQEETDKSRERYIDDRNVYMYKHGVAWSTSKSDEKSFMRIYTIEAESNIHFKDVIDHKTSVLDAHVQTLADAFNSQFAVNFYETINEVTERTGNVVPMGDVSNGDDLGMAVRRGLEQIQWGVDRYGKPTPPQIHVGREAFEKFKALSESGEGETDEEMDALNAKKEKEAISREADRISRYRFR